MSECISQVQHVSDVGNIGDQITHQMMKKICVQTVQSDVYNTHRCETDTIEWSIDKYVLQSAKDVMSVTRTESTLSAMQAYNDVWGKIIVQTSPSNCNLF